MLKQCVLAGLMSVLAAAPALAQEGWVLEDGGMGAGRSCVALKRGEEVNTRLMRNGRNQMILVAAKSAWNSNDPITARLSIDGAEPVTVLGLRVGPLVMVQVDKPDMDTALKAARTLDWTMPWGSFHADVAGLGEAFAKVEACRS